MTLQPKVNWLSRHVCSHGHTPELPISSVRSRLQTASLPGKTHLLDSYTWLQEPENLTEAWGGESVS